MVAGIRRVKEIKHPEMVFSHFMLFYSIFFCAVCKVNTANIPSYEVKNNGFNAGNVPNPQIQNVNMQAQQNLAGAAGGGANLNNIKIHQDIKKPFGMGNNMNLGQQHDNQPNMVLGGQAGQQRPIGARKNIMLSTHPDCQEDVEALCNTDNLRKNNFAVLDCLQADIDIQVQSPKLFISPSRRET
jgi:hypothetical protein